MKQNKSSLFLFCTLLSLVSLIATIIIFPQLPAEIPIHWNLAGEIDDYGSRYFTFFTASLPLILLVLFRVIPKIDPKQEAFNKHPKAYHMLILAMTILMIGIHWLTLLAALGYALPVGTLIPIAIGLLFIILGNYMPQIRPNYSFGIRLPWTLANEDNWRYTHRFGGYMFILCGILFILDGLLPTSAFTGFSLVCIFVCMLAICVYSYLYYAKHEKKSN